jgi:glycosyltransferase involved in cell wall biosynthesis
VKVLQISHSDYGMGGGGAIAMHRLHTGLQQVGIDCKILSGRKTLTSADSTQLVRSSLEPWLRQITSRLGLNEIHCLRSFAIQDHPLYLEADVLNFHILHSGFFSYLALPRLTRTKPAIFTLHDMWSFTGHCAYSFDCDRWQTGCGHCPHPDSYPAIQHDNTRLEWRLKNWVYDRAELTIVAPSRWLAEQAKQSILQQFAIHHIPNGIDTEVYQPRNRQQCRSLLGIPDDQYVLLAGAEKFTDRRKGADLLLSALNRLPDALKACTVLLMLGNGGGEITQRLDIPTVELGFVSGDRMKAIAYSAADLFVFPTRADNLPLMLQESMACGVPMVSFRVGGVPDLVRPGVTGYLAAPESVEEFAQGIENLLSDRPLREQLSQNCRAIALAEYPLELQAKRYIELYRQVVQR